MEKKDGKKVSSGKVEGNSWERGVGVSPRRTPFITIAPSNSIVSVSRYFHGYKGDRTVNVAKGDKTNLLPPSTLVFPWMKSARTMVSENYERRGEKIWNRPTKRVWASHRLYFATPRVFEFEERKKVMEDKEGEREKTMCEEKITCWD